MVVSSPNVLSRVRNRVSRGQGIVVQRYSTASDPTKVSSSEPAHNFSLLPDSSSSSVLTLGSLPGIQLRPLPAPGSVSERPVASSTGDLIRVGLRPPYELQVDYDLQSIGYKLHDYPSWTAFLLAFDVEKLRQLGHGQSLEELCACTRRLTWVVRACRCSEFVPLDVRSGSSTARVTLTPEAASRHSCMAIVRVVVCLKEGDLDINDRGVTNNWMSWGDPLVVRTLPPLDDASEELQRSATEKLIAQLRENLCSANSERQDLESRMEAATTKCNEENTAALRAQAALQLVRAGLDPEAFSQQEALQSEFRSSESEQDVLRRGLFAALELAGERGRTEASLKRELEATERRHCELQAAHESLQESGALHLAEQQVESLRAERDEASEQLAAASSRCAQEKEDLHQVKKMLKMAETEHLAAMKDLRETVDKLGESRRLETGAKFALDAAEARNNSLHVELLVARRGADQESATQADLETRLQASEAFGSELERQLQVANEEYLAAEQLCKQVGSDFSTPSRSSQTWKETSDCSTSASSPHLRRPESSPCTTLPESGEDEKSELEYRWLSAALSEVQDVRGELTQSMLRIAQLEKSKDDLEDKLVATSAEQYVLNIECTESREHEELKDELERRVQDSKDRLDEMEGERSELRRKLAALTADHARLSLAYRTPAKLMWLVEAAIVFFTLEDFDYDAFMSDEVLVNRFRSKVKEVIASEAGEGVQPHYVELEICAGSLKVIAKVETSSGQEVSAQIALCTSTELETRLVESVKSIPGISKVWNSSTTLTDFKLEVPWPAEVESRLRESAKKHVDMERKLNHSAQLRDSLVTKWLLHSARTRLQAEAQEEKFRSLELEQDRLRGEFKDAALKSIVETVTTRLEMDAALDIGRSETEMQQKLEESHESLRRCHEETLSALSIAESRQEELEADAVAWLAATREACTEQDALRKCLTSKLDSEAELKSELDIGKSENAELRRQLHLEMEAHAAKNRFDEVAPEDKFQIEFEEEGASLLFFINEFHEFEVWAVTAVLHAERWDVHPGDIITGANGEKFPRNDRDALRQALLLLLSSSKPVLFDLRHRKKAGRLSIFSLDRQLHEAPVELHKATISYEHRTTCLKDLNKWWKEWMEVLGIADKEEFKSKYPSHEQLTYDKNGVDVQLADINNVSEERFPVTFEVRLQSKSKAPSELHRKTISYQDRATWREDLQKWWMSLMESIGVADKMDFKGKLSSSEIVIRLYDNNGGDLQLADMDDLSEERFPVTFEIRLLSKAQADATRLERVLAEHSATKAEFDEERAAFVAASELAKSEEVAWRNAIKTHAEKDRACSNARLETSHAEKDAEIMKNALQAHATLQASAVEKDKAALLENRTPEPEGWYDSQAEKKVEAAEALYAALKKDHDTTVKNLKKREEEYSHLEVDHASKKNMLKELEEATEKAKVDAEKAKRQNENLKEELEQEKRKGKCCSQM